MSQGAVSYGTANTAYLLPEQLSKERMAIERTLYKEVWECRLPRKLTVEEELTVLQSLSPDMMEDIDSIFREVLTDVLANVLGTSGAMVTVRLIGEAILQNPPHVFKALDAIFLGGSYVLKNAIAEEFRANLHELSERVKRQQTSAPILLKKELSAFQE